VILDLPVPLVPLGLQDSLVYVEVLDLQDLPDSLVLLEQLELLELLVFRVKEETQEALEILELLVSITSEQFYSLPELTLVNVSNLQTKHSFLLQCLYAGTFAYYCFDYPCKNSKIAKQA